MEFDDDDDRKLEEWQKPEDPTDDGEPREENLDPIADPPEHDGRFATDAERFQMLRDEILHAKIANAFRKKGVPESAYDDLLQVTLIAAFRAPNLPGGSGVERDRFVLRTAGNKAVDYRRNASRQVELVEKTDPDEVAPSALHADPVAERDFLAKVLKVPASDEPLLRSFKRYKLEEERLKDIAKDEQIPYRTLQKRLQDFEERMRERARKMLKYGRIIGGVATLLLALGLSRWKLEPVPGMMHDEPGAISMLEPAVSTHVTQVDPRDWAAVLRGEAFASCVHYDWKQCLNGLDAARDLDPDGDADPSVQAARNDAFDGISAGLKPGPAWHPKGPRPYAGKASR